MKIEAAAFIAGAVTGFLPGKSDRRKFYYGKYGGKNMTKAMTKHLAVILAVFAVIFLLAGCVSSDPAEKEYLAESEIDSALSDGDSYKGKNINIAGKVLNIDTK